MTDRDAFLARILAEPADDTHRLVFADWLQDQDDRVPCPECKGAGSMVWSGPQYISNHTCLTCSGSRSVPAGNADRAEFIRYQIEADRTTCPGCRPDFPCRAGGLCRKRKYLERSSALLAAHGRAWSGEIAGVLGVDDFTLHDNGWFTPRYHRPESMRCWRFSRGFPGSVRLPTSAEFVGDRVCEACRGDGTYLGMPRSSNPGLCSRCAGLGRVRPCPMRRDHGGTIGCACGDTRVLPALAPRLARVPGIATVEIGDRVPAQDRIWYRAGRPDPYPGIPESAELPPLLFDLLDGYNVDKELDPEVTPGRWKSYPDLALATSALALAGGGLLQSLRKGI